MKDLQEVMTFIAQKYIFSPENYPGMKNIKNATQHLAFVSNHSLLHMTKATGKLATVLEEYEHKNGLHFPTIEEATVKMFINSLKLAQELGMTADSLINLVPKYMKSK